MPSPAISEEGKTALSEFIKETKSRHDLPATIYGITNADHTIYGGCVGKRIYGNSKEGEVTQDTILQLFSMTKFITSVGCLVLVDQGLVSLDSSDDIQRILPELSHFKRFKGARLDRDGQVVAPAIPEEAGANPQELVEVKNKITLRMLLTHTSGLSYLNGSTSLMEWARTHPSPSMLSSKASLASWTHPLLFEPNAGWQYSDGIDWAGELIMRVSKFSLDEFFRKYIFSKTDTGAPSLSFFPPKDLEKVAMRATQRLPDGKISIGPWATMDRELDPSKISSSQAGGAGMWGTATDYLAMLRGVLASSPTNSNPPTKPILSPSSYAELFKDNLPPSSSNPHVRAKEDLQEGLTTKERWYQPPPASPDDAGHSIAGVVNLKPLASGRQAGSVSWAGAARTQFWVDPATGIAGVCCTQLMEDKPIIWHKHYNDFETVVYKALA